MLFSLPIDLLRVVFDYLSLKELVNLDRSILSHSLRPLFTEALTGYEILSLDKLSCNCLFLEWVTSRRFLVTCANLSEYSSSIARAFFAANRSSLRVIKFFGSCGELLDDRVFTYLKECPRLNTISFDTCGRITDDGVQCLLTEAPTTETMEETTSSNSKEFPSSLKTLEFSDCFSLTNKIATFVAQTCPKLHHLNLSGIDRLADPDVDAIIEGCPLLLSLDLSKTSITDAAVRQILEAYPNLQTLTLYNCNGVSLATKAEVLRRISLREIQTDSRQLQLFGANSLRKALSDEYHPPIDEVVEMGAVPRLIEFLSYEDSPVLQFEAAWALTNIASGSTAHTLAVVEAGAVPALIQLLYSPHENVLEQAAWALGNIAGDNPDCRDFLNASGALHILSTVEVSTPTVMRNIAWAVSNLCRGKPAPDLDIVRVSFPFLLKRLLGDDVEAKADACWALSYISDGDNSRIEAILEAGFLQPIVAILDSDSNEMLRTASQRVIGNILSGDESQTQQVLDTSILSIFKKLLIQSHRLDFRKEICWSISNITAGTADQLQRVFDSGILIDIMDLGLNRATPPDLLKECVFCISNATHVAIDNQMTFLVMISGLHFLFRVLPRMSRSNLVIVLEGIVNILQKQPNAIEGIPDEVLKPIPRLTRLPGDVGEMARKIMELIPSRFEGVVLSADTEPFEADDNDDSDSDEWESIDAEEENEDEEGEDDEEEDEGDEA